MKPGHDKAAQRVAEPVQVYLDKADKARLERLVLQLDATKSDVLRRALSALEQQLTDPASHPALRVIGIAAGHERRMDPAFDAAVGHDEFLANSEVASWGARKPARRAR
ncbi:MAG: ribbon-helix-helix protein, CopG family [Gemmatimonadaceae bacterium]